MTKYEWKNDFSKMLRMLRNSRTLKIKHGWSRDMGAGFIKEDIKEVELLKTCPFGVTRNEACEDDVCQNCEYRKVEGKDIICKYPPPNAIKIAFYFDHVQTFKTNDLNLRETEELIKWLIEKNAEQTKQATQEQI